MKCTFILLLLLQSIFSTGQKSYKIYKTYWRIEKPKNYIFRIDNFDSASERGDKFINKNYDLGKQSNDDKILFSAGRKDSLDVNMILGSYKNNSNIVKFTLKGYVDKLAAFFESGYKKQGAEIKLTIKTQTISNEKFYVIENKIYFKEKNYTYWTTMYIAEIDNKEFNIMATYDNEQDKKEIENSILKSKFVSE